VSNITFKPIETFRNNDHKAVRGLKAEKIAGGKIKKAKRGKIQKSMSSDESTDPNLASRLADLIAGRKPAVPTPLDVQLREIQIEIRNNEDDISFLGKVLRSRSREANA
jgi:hypothetical protein